MDDNPDITRIRATIKSARAEVNRQNGALALEHLRGIKGAIKHHEFTAEWVDYSLTIGEAFLLDRSPSAEGFLKEAEEKLARIPDPPDDLRIRLYEHLGDFYGTVPPKKLSSAKRYFVLSKEVAVGRHIDEEIARINLKIVCADLQTDNDPKLQDFQTLRRVARHENCTCTRTFAAWTLHLGNLGESMNGIRFARQVSKASEEYFRDLLQSVGMK